MISTHIPSAIDDTRAIFQDGDHPRGRTATTEGIVGESLALKSVLQEVSLVAPTDTTVLILGENRNRKRTDCARYP